MPEFYRVMLKRTPDSEPELWTNYATPEDAQMAANGLVDSGEAVQAWVVPVTNEDQKDGDQ